MTTLTVPKLTDSAEFRKAKKQREDLRREAEKIRKELEDLGPGAPYLEEKRAKLGERLRDKTAELQSAGNAFQTEKRRVGASTADALAASPGYQKLIFEALASWADTHAHWLALAAVVTEVRRTGVEVQPLPPVIALEIEQMVGWIEASIRRGTLDTKVLPEPLRKLVKGENE